MKKFYLLFILFILSINILIAQQIFNTFKPVLFYNPFQVIINESYCGFNCEFNDLFGTENLSQFGNTVEITCITEDSLNHGNFINTIHHTLKINKNGQLSQHILDKWDGNFWKKYYRLVYNYNNNNLIQIQRENYSFTDGIYKKSGIKIMNYNANGNIIDSSIYRNTDNNKLYLKDSFTFEYYSSGLRKSMTSVPWITKTFEYNSNGQIINDGLKYLYLNGNLVLVSTDFNNKPGTIQEKLLYFYNSKNLIDSFIYLNRTINTSSFVKQYDSKVYYSNSKIPDSLVTHDNFGSKSTTYFTNSTNLFRKETIYFNKKMNRNYSTYENKIRDQQGRVILVNAGYINFIIQSFSRKYCECSVDGTTSLKPFNKRTNLDVFPNPSNDAIIVRIPDNIKDEAIIQLYDISRKVLFTGKTGEKEFYKLDVSDFPTGVYIISLKSKDNILTKKVIVQ